MATATSRTSVVPRAEWLAARRELLRKEKELTRLRDEVSRQRRELPWQRVTKKYTFHGPQGEQSLSDLFEGRSQLVVYHFMFGPGWREGCPGCSFLADTFDGCTVHLAHRDVTFMAISRATLPEIEAFKKRMGWKFKWFSSFASDFNFDYQASFAEEDRAKGKLLYNFEMTEIPVEDLPGMSVFFKDEAGEIFHTYSSYSRGLDPMIGTYQWLDLTPKGRDEEGLAQPMAWMRHHDKYDDTYRVVATRGYVPPEKVEGACCSEKVRA